MGEDIKGLGGRPELPARVPERTPESPASLLIVGSIWQRTRAKSRRTAHRVVKLMPGRVYICSTQRTSAAAPSSVWWETSVFLDNHVPLSDGDFAKTGNPGLNQKGQPNG